MMLLGAGVRGLGAAPGIANKAAAAMHSEDARVAPILSHDSQSGDWIRPRGWIFEQRRRGRAEL